MNDQNSIVKQWRDSKVLLNLHQKPRIKFEKRLVEYVDREASTDPAFGLSRDINQWYQGLKDEIAHIAAKDPRRYSPVSMRIEQSDLGLHRFKLVAEKMSVGKGGIVNDTEEYLFMTIEPDPERFKAKMTWSKTYETW